jgi:hypothetical protein
MLMPDGGPVYAEYNPNIHIVEPWNAASSLFMMLPAIYWFFRWRKHTKISPFIGFALIMVFLSGLGSALFHAFRISPLFLMLDVIPSTFLTFAISIWFWLKIVPKKWYVLFIFLPVFLLRFAMSGNLPQHIGTNVTYAISGLLVIIPLLIFLYRNHFNDWHLVVLVLLSFGLALLFRQLDSRPWLFLPQGTHFLWHIFSAAGSYFMLGYLKSAQQISDNSLSMKK